MRVVQYLGVTGAMQSEANMRQQFVLPDNKNVMRSLRFGAHAFSLNETMQILPIGNYERVKPAGNGREENGPAKRIVRSLFNGCNVRSLLM